MANLGGGFWGGLSEGISKAADTATKAIGMQQAGEELEIKRGMLGVAQQDVGLRKAQAEIDNKIKTITLTDAERANEPLPVDELYKEYAEKDPIMANNLLAHANRSGMINQNRQIRRADLLSLQKTALDPGFLRDVAKEKISDIDNQIKTAKPGTDVAALNIKRDELLAGDKELNNILEYRNKKITAEAAKTKAETDKAETDAKIKTLYPAQAAYYTKHGNYLDAQSLKEKPDTAEIANQKGKDSIASVVLKSAMENPAFLGLKPDEQEAWLTNNMNTILKLTGRAGTISPAPSSSTQLGGKNAQPATIPAPTASKQLGGGKTTLPTTQTLSIYANPEQVNGPVVSGAPEGVSTPISKTAFGGNAVSIIPPTSMAGIADRMPIIKKQEVPSRFGEWLTNAIKMNPGVPVGELERAYRQKYGG